jgi:hypothetical protein
MRHIVSKPKVLGGLIPVARAMPSFERFNGSPGTNRTTYSVEISIELTWPYHRADGDSDQHKYL